MKKYIRYSLWTATVVVATAVSAAVYITVTFNPNDYKAQIIQLVKDKNQRTLKLGSDIKLSFFPSLGVNMGNVSLSEFQSDNAFLTIDSARISLALLPLLFKQMLVDEVTVKGLKVGLVKYKNGKTNIDDMLSMDEGKSDGQLVKFDIALVNIENTELHYHDEATGAQYTLKDLNLHTGRIANSVPSKIDFSALIQANQPKIDIAMQLGTTLTFDLDQQLYQIEGMKLKAKGAVLDIDNLLAQANGDVSANLVTQEFMASKLVAMVSGTKSRDSFDAKLNAPSLNLTKDIFSSDMLTLNAKLDSGVGDISANFILHDLAGNAQLFKSSALTLELEMKKPDRVVNIKLNSPVTGSLEQQQLNFSNTTVAVNVSGNTLQNNSVSSEMKGSVQLDGIRQSAQANFSGGLLQSQIKIRIGARHFTKPAIRFDVEADQFDANQYLPQEASGSAKNSAAAEQPLDMSVLKDLNLEGSLRIGKFKVGNVKFTKMGLDIKAHNGQFNVNPLSANLYQGNINGSFSVNAQDIPSIAIKQKLSGVNIAPLLKDVANLDMLEGKGNLSISLGAQGNTMRDLKKSLNGNMALNLADGSIRGINLGKRMRELQTLGKGDVTAQTRSANMDEKTEFSEFKASFKVNNGVAHNEDLSVKAQQLRLTGSGDIDIGNGSINYVARATLSKNADVQKGSITVPVHLNGPFSDLKYKLDMGAMVADIAKQKVDAKKEQIKEQIQERLKSRLKGLFN